MTKRISGSEYPLSKIFSSEFEYIIPSYQRPYAWTVDQASELFDDLFDFYESEIEDGYFLGSIVLIKQEGIPKAEVIDGQQRLTTLTILFAALASITSGKDRDTLRKYIVEPGNKFEGLEEKPRLSLREKDRAFFSTYVQNLRFDELISLGQQSLSNEAQKNIQLNSRLLLDRIEKRFVNDSEKIQSFIAFLLQRCFIVAVSTPSQQSAFRIFSVMNNRGLDLQPTDIIKADIIGGIAERKRDSYSERWEDLEIVLGRKIFNDLFAYIRTIYAKSKQKKALIEEFKAYVLPKFDQPELLITNILEPYGEALTIVLNGNYKSNTNALTINNYLRWLGRIDNSDWIPASILFLVQKKDDAEYVQWFFERMERLAAYMHISAKNVNERIERYNQIINQLEYPHSLATPVSSLELTNKEKQEFLQCLDGEIYTLTARRRNYLILRLDSFISDCAASYDANLLTIEHVLPQTVNDGGYWSTNWPVVEERKYWVHRLANLVPLNKRRNSAAQNYDFETKKSAYFSGVKNVSSYAITTQVLAAVSWTNQILKERQSKLLDILSENWRLN